MKKYIFTLLTIGLLSFYSQAQTGLIRGALIDSDFQDPVPFANIVVKEICEWGDVEVKGASSDRSRFWRERFTVVSAL